MKSPTFEECLAEIQTQLLTNCPGVRPEHFQLGTSFAEIVRVHAQLIFDTNQEVKRLLSRLPE